MARNWTNLKERLQSTAETVTPRNFDDKYSKICPTCNAGYEKGAKLVVCGKDGTLLLPTSHLQKRMPEQVAKELLLHNLEVRSHIGEGDLSDVYEAVETNTGKTVVVKAIKSNIVGNSDRAQRFASSLQETVELRHPNILSVLSAGVTRDALGRLQQVYYVVEKLHALNLKTILHETGPIAPFVVIETMIQVCDTLDYAQKRGWLHKDLKLSNIYVSLRDEQLIVKVADFGVADRMFHYLEWESNATKTGSIYGNAAYMAPETGFQSIRGVTSDIYSLGCMMYHVLKGMAPFEGLNDFGTLQMHLFEDPRKFADELKIPRELEAVVFKCLAKVPEKRFQSFIELRDALNQIQSLE